MFNTKNWSKNTLFKQIFIVSLTVETKQKTEHTILSQIIIEDYFCSQCAKLMSSIGIFAHVLESAHTQKKTGIKDWIWN